MPNRHLQPYMSLILREIHNSYARLAPFQVTLSDDSVSLTYSTNSNIQKLQRRKAEGLKDTPPFTQTWINYANASFNLQRWGVENQTFLVTVITQPGALLRYGTGSQSLSFVQTWSSLLGVKEVIGYIIWQDPSNKRRFWRENCLHRPAMVVYWSCTILPSLLRRYPGRG